MPNLVFNVKIAFVAYLEMAAQVNIINECRAICISGRLNNSNANLWIKCQTLGENWVSASFSISYRNNFGIRVKQTLTNQ